MFKQGNCVVGTALLELRCWNCVVRTALLELRCGNCVVGAALLELRYWNEVVGSVLWLTSRRHSPEGHSCLHIRSKSILTSYHTL